MMQDHPEAVLRVENLSVSYRREQKEQEAVRDVSFSIAPGQIFGLVGESGSGKSTLAQALFRHLPENGRITNGKIWFEDRNILTLNPQELRKIWGTRIAYVPQDPGSSLNPSMRIGDQIAEGIRAHTGLSRQALSERVLALLKMVRLPEPEQVAASYPHQVSGGMKQRILIAVALSLYPTLLVLDEPTTNLDVTTQAAIIELITDLVFGSGTAVLYITHNLGVVAQNCDRVAVMYAGELVEEAPQQVLFGLPVHPYTQGLFASVPAIGVSKHQTRLSGIPGVHLQSGSRPTGCCFEPRCPLAAEVCQTIPPALQVNSGHWVRCHRWVEAASRLPYNDKAIPYLPRPIDGSASQVEEYQDRTALEVKGLRVDYKLPRSLADYLALKPGKTLRAVRGMDLSARTGMTIGLVGESGGGKTTVARAVVGLVERASGAVELFGIPLPALLEQRSPEVLRELQMVFQNPEEALNPHITVGESLRRPLINLGCCTGREADKEVGRLLAMVQLSEEYAVRYPGQLSGGEKQRVAIARAYAANPDVLIADEPVSSLDVSVQASILNLLVELQLQAGTTMLFISHDIAAVGYLADVVAVIYLGSIMELTRADNLFKPPYHPYTEALLSAVPGLDQNSRKSPIILENEIPSPIDIPTGCPFHTRCHRSLGEVCRLETPPWQETIDGDRIFCHISLAELELLQAAPISTQG